MLEAKNTENKYKTVKQNKNPRNKIINHRVHDIKNLVKRRLHEKIFFNKKW